VVKDQSEGGSADRKVDVFSKAVNRGGRGFLRVTFPYRERGFLSASKTKSGSAVRDPFFSCFIDCQPADVRPDEPGDR
jgi:hypothetical protein